MRTTRVHAARRRAILVARLDRSTIPRDVESDRILGWPRLVSIALLNLLLLLFLRRLRRLRPVDLRVVRNFLPASLAGCCVAGSSKSPKSPGNRVRQRQRLRRRPRRRRRRRRRERRREKHQERRRGKTTKNEDEDKEGNEDEDEDEDEDDDDDGVSWRWSIARRSTDVATLRRVVARGSYSPSPLPPPPRRPQLTPEQPGN